jgi:hypothetical protein
LAAKEKALMEREMGSPRGVKSMMEINGNDGAAKEVSTTDKSGRVKSINYSAASRAKLPPLGASDGVRGVAFMRHAVRRWVLP